MEPSATNGSATVDVYASAADVYTFLTDLERLPTLSPENERCEFLGDATSIAVGARFRGHNRAKDYTWHADCEVTVADPGRGFAYEVPPAFEHTTTWSYTIEPTGPSSCRVTESFDAPMLALPDVYPGKIEGRRDNLERGCQITMQNLQSAFTD
ncbi:SRPBCC family protein [uncultured Ilumatobacter sp.]|uniref:SRPBCC family protein n=1 Tax=uncultured Ilumatobacter sp. TaxID=879968 RepID=UPI00374E5488